MVEVPYCVSVWSSKVITFKIIVQLGQTDRQTNILFYVYNDVHSLQNGLQYNACMIRIILAFKHTEQEVRKKEEG